MDIVLNSCIYICMLCIYHKIISYSATNDHKGCAILYHWPAKKLTVAEHLRLW